MTHPTPREIQAEILDVIFEYEATRHPNDAPFPAITSRLIREGVKRANRRFDERNDK
jgi:hypothetical protein